MPRLRSPITIAVAAGLAGTASLIGFSANPASAETVTVPLHTMVADLPVADEQRDGYDRDLFKHWIDEDGDGCNTRYEVLIEEAVTAPTVDDDCKLTGGEWYSYFDDKTVDSPSGIGIDHFIPLAEAWDSGAHSWTDDKRRDFANDLGDERALVGVTTSSNSSKGDRDPAEWMPPNPDATCRYVTEWVAVKTRWGLTVDDTEKAALTDLAGDCPNEDITVDVVDGASTPPGDSCAAVNATAVDIPDTKIATSVVTVSDCSGNASATSTVTVEITHPDRGDVSVWLYAPDGTHYVLKPAGGSGADLRAEYEVDLSDETAVGDWTLSVKDYSYGESGSLDSWSIQL
ncbi:MAG TPA: proprotein convertase P-domain-containing protein [Candidatus Stackebrandtia excrementipullorum]|nr:proprotein convertase P-domain-containing protein [Candidatus Stackebrandtia excrementipullorum]